MSRIARHLIFLLVLSLLAPALAAAKDDIRFLSMASIEVEQVNAKGEKVKVRQPAADVAPGSIVIYTNNVTNFGKKAADHIVINSPVPAKTEYVGGSATEKDCTVLFSIDGGKSFGKPVDLTVPDGKGGKRQAEPKEYTNIRWTLLSPVPPEATGSVEFRVRVK